MTKAQLQKENEELEKQIARLRDKVSELKWNLHHVDNRNKQLELKLDSKMLGTHPFLRLFRLKGANEIVEGDDEKAIDDLLAKIENKCKKHDGYIGFFENYYRAFRSIYHSYKNKT